MPKTYESIDLPAPISLTLDEARQVAAGALSLQLAPWWWFGQPVNLTPVSQITNPVNIAVGQFAAFGH
jgi:hypothetical protein